MKGRRREGKRAIKVQVHLYMQAYNKSSLRQPIGLQIMLAITTLGN